MKVVLTLPSRDSLKQIHDYYKEHVSVTIANKIKAGIILRLQFLSANPYAGQTEDFLVHLGLGHRRWVEGNYKIIYRIIDQTIYITDIFDSRRDPSEISVYYGIK